LTNVFHIHLPPIGEQPSIDNIFIEENQMKVNIENLIEEYKKTWENDPKSINIKYRIIAEKGKISYILYNFRGMIGKAKFEEISYETNEILNITNLNFNNKWGKIQQIPIQLLIGSEKLKNLENTMPQHETILACRGRTIENLLGYIDIEIIHDSLEKPANFKEISVPICECEKDLSNEGKIWVQSKFENWEKIENAKLTKIIDDYKKLIQKYTQLEKSEMKNILEESRKIEGELVSFSDKNLSKEKAVFSCILNKKIKGNDGKNIERFSRFTKEISSGSNANE